jgi:hypothetical protein
MSLYTKLHEFIKKNKRVSYQDIVDGCQSGLFGKIYKPSNAERRLRPSESPEIRTIRKNGSIAYYEYRSDEEIEELRFEAENNAYESELANYRNK